MDTIDADILAQFLRECEPPTPPSASSSSCLGPIPTNFISSSSEEFPTSFGRALQLEEDDKQALLDALDAYATSVPSVSSDQNEIVIKTRSQTLEEIEAQKLAIQREKATKRRNRHRAR
ncbi:hypothetical protein F442_13287, partial [Phytophthora nicotianae P10297]